MVSRECIEWLRIAKMDITAAQQLYTQQQNPRHRPIEIILFHCQQGAEKALKAYLVQHGVFTKEDISIVTQTRNNTQIRKKH